MSINLADIKERCEKAAPGPWVHYTKGQVAIEIPHLKSYEVICNTLGSDGPLGYLRRKENAEWIVASRTDVPAMVAWIERAIPYLNAMRAHVMWFGDESLKKLLDEIK